MIIGPPPKFHGTRDILTPQPKFINTGFYWYDKSNINDPKIAALLYK